MSGFLTPVSYRYNNLLTKMKHMKSQNTLFEPSLTLRNANEKGYHYIDDVIYDFINPSETMNDILEFLREFQGKLGTPANQKITHYFGLFVPQ